MLRAGHGLILLVIALLVFGVIMVTSAGLTVRAPRSIDLHAVMWGRSTMLAAFSVGMLWLGTRVPVDRLGAARGVAAPLPWILLGCVILLIAVHVPGIGREVNGARRWITIGGFGFQPSEVAKWGTVVMIAAYAAQRPGEMRRFTAGFAAPMLMVLLVCGLIATEDLGTAVLISAVAVGMLIAAGAKLWHAALLMPVGAVAFAVAVVASPYRIDRLRAFLDPYQDPQGIGYHVLQSMGAVAGGGLAGRGLGNSVQKFGYLPEDTTDFIFAIICEELGVMGAAIVISLYTGLLLCGLAIIVRARRPFARLLGLGVLLTIGAQAVLNMAVVTGMAPTKGIALPLLSSGGTGWALTAFSVGMLVSIDRSRHRAAAGVEAELPVLAHAV